MSGVLLAATGVAVYGEDGAATTTRHCQPVWKLVLPLDGQLRLTSVDGREVVASGLLVPPGMPHAVAATGGYRCLMVEPWVDRFFTVKEPVNLQERLVRQLIADLTSELTHGTGELAAVAVEALSRLHRETRLPEAAAPLPLIRRAAVEAGDVARLGDLAEQIGLSPVQLRRLVRQQLGVTLSQLRQWQRLRSAFATDAGSLAQRAADAGYSDQAHMTRASRRFVGRTPAEVVQAEP